MRRRTEKKTLHPPNLTTSQNTGTLAPPKVGQCVLSRIATGWTSTRRSETDHLESSLTTWQQNDTIQKTSNTSNVPSHLVFAEILLSDWDKLNKIWKKLLDFIARGLGHVGGARFWSSATCGFCEFCPTNLARFATHLRCSPCHLEPCDLDLGICQFVHIHRWEIDKTLSKTLDASFRLNPLQTIKSSEIWSTNQWDIFNRHNSEINKRFISQCLGGVKALCLDTAVSFRKVSGVSEAVCVASGRIWSTATALFFISWSVPRNSIKVNFIHVWFSVRQHKNVNKMALKGVKEMKNEKLWRWKKHVLFHCMGGNQLLSGFSEWCKASDFMHWFQLTSAAPSIFSRNGWKRKATNVWPTSAQCLWHRQGCFAACVFMQYNGMLLEPISLDQGTNENDINCTNGK